MFKGSRFSLRAFSLGVRPEMTLAEQSAFYVINWAVWSMLVFTFPFIGLNLAQQNWQLLRFNVTGVVIALVAVVFLARGRSLLALGTLCAASGTLIFFQSLTCGNGTELILIHFFVLGSFLLVNTWFRRLLALACAAGFVFVQTSHFQASGVKGSTLERFTVNYVIGMMSLYGVIALLRSVINRYHRTLEEQRRALEEANRAKERLFAIVSHDLRGPIVRLKDSVDHLVAGRLTPERFETIQGVLRTDIHQLHASMENVLQWASSQMASPVPRFERVTLRAAADEALGLLLPVAHDKGIAVENRIPAEASVRADAGQVQAILRNLLSNALKFTASGGKVTLAAQPRPGAWEIAVADTGTGRGSGAEVVRRLLAGEAVEPGLGTARERGLGLGLRLCRDFVAALDGTIGADPAPEGGTVLRVTLPGMQGV